MDIIVWKILFSSGEGKIIYLLGLIAAAMIIDFISGCICAKMTGEFKSKTGINGILKKMVSMMVLLLFFMMNFLLPEGIGFSLTAVLYTGYLMMEIQSILENMDKLGINTDCFKKTEQAYKDKLKEEKDGKDSNR